MDKKQQTAVEWFMEKIGEKQPNGMYLIDTLEDVQNLFEQAKAMEKEQRIADYNVGYQDAQCNHINDAENYANEQKYLNNKEV